METIEEIKKGFVDALLLAYEWEDASVADEAAALIDKLISRFVDDFPGLCDHPEDFRTASYNPAEGTLREYLGHDLALSALRTGTGFHDKRYGDLDKFLMAWCDCRPQLEPYLGDDGKVYF